MHGLDALGLVLADRGLGLVFILLLLLSLHAFWQWRLLATSAEVWLPATAELAAQGPNGPLVAVFRDHAGRRRSLPVAILLPRTEAARIAAGASLALTYCRRAPDLAYATTWRERLSHRLLWRLRVFVPLTLLLAVILSLLDPLMPG
jgi:hypothetical protein